MDSADLSDRFATPPAVHRFSNKMSDYTQRVAKAIVDKYDGNAANIWNDGADTDTIQKRVQSLPGFGPAKSSKLKYALHFLGYRDFSGA